MTKRGETAREKWGKESRGEGELFRRIGGTNLEKNLDEIFRNHLHPLWLEEDRVSCIQHTIEGLRR